MKSEFDGGILGYWGWSLICAILTVFTLGLATPWAVCLFWSWETKHTVIDGKRLTFDGNGAQLFGNYIKWLVLTFVTFGIYGFWLYIKLVQWKTKHTHFVD